MATFDWKSEAQEQWDVQAAHWNKKSRNMWDSGSRKDIIPNLSNHLEQGSTVLDIGCGDGYGTYQLNKRYEATGIDFSSEMIQHAKAGPQGSTISFLHGDVNQLPFVDNHFDGAISINVLEWIENPFYALQEMKRVLKEKGILVVGILGPTAGPRANSYPRLVGERAICNTMMPWEFKMLAEELSFVHIDDFGVYKSGVEERHYQDLPIKLKQSLSFLWVFIMRMEGGKNER